MELNSRYNQATHTHTHTHAHACIWGIGTFFRWGWGNWVQLKTIRIEIQKSTSGGTCKRSLHWCNQYHEKLLVTSRETLNVCEKVTCSDAQRPCTCKYHIAWFLDEQYHHHLELARNADSPALHETYDSGAQGGGASTLDFNKPSRWLYCMLTFRNQWQRGPRMKSKTVRSRVDVEWGLQHGNDEPERPTKATAKIPNMERVEMLLLGPGNGIKNSKRCDLGTRKGGKAALWKSQVGKYLKNIFLTRL